MNTVERLAVMNAGLLQQGIDVLTALDENQYTVAVPGAFGASIGAHFRHVLDHYSLFIAGCDSGRIDYSARLREPRLEADRDYALGVACGLAERLPLVAGDAPDALRVKLENGDADADDADWGASTVSRELDFLASHTVHHYALIAMVLRSRQLEVKADFGIAPSTLRHQIASAECAQ